MPIEAALVGGAFAVGLKAFDYLLADYFKEIKDGPTEFKRKLEEAKNELRKMEATLKDSEEWLYQGDKSFHSIKNYIHRVQDIAHIMEDVVDEFDLEMAATENQNELKKAIESAWSTCATKRSKAAKDIAYLLQQPCPDCSPLNSSPSSGSTIWSPQDLADGDELGDGLLDFEPYKTELLEMLKMENRLHILVSGPGGSGKSSLVKKFYGREGLFSVYLWFPGKKLLSEREGKKFLVVVDNVRKEKDLKPVQQELKKDTQGSKIVITSRNTRIASSLKPLYTVDLSRGLLSRDAKKLFCSKAFPDGKWDPYVDREAQLLLDKCERIPLAISIVAERLADEGTTIPADWKMVYDILGSELCDVDSTSRLSEIRHNLQPSYDELPSHLKGCFMYFSMFPVGEEINRGRLMRLWVAENFAEPKKGKTGEQVAEDYLDQLAQRNLVVVCKAGTSGPVSKCRVLELVHEINISRRYNFITVLESDYRSPCGNNCKIRRLSAQNGGFKLLKERKTLSDMTGLRTFLVFGQKTSLSDLKMVLAESKFLKVLDLQGVPNLEQFPDQVFDLILLKYSSMRGTKVNRIPNRIKKLVRLETLDLKRTQVTHLPDDVYELQNLLALLVSSSSGKKQGAQGVQVSGKVSSFSSIQIQKLSLITVDTEERIEALKKLKALRKLGVVTKDGSKLATVLEEMEHLKTLDVRSSRVQLLNLDKCKFPEYLRRLHLSGTVPSRSLLEQISKQYSLQKIRLHGSYLPRNLLDHFQDLSSLIELDLRGDYNGTKFEFKADKFKKLETLVIEEVTELESIVFENGATRMLKKLTVSKMSLYKTNQQTAQPLDHLQDLPSLIELDLRGCYGSELEFKADKFEKLETLIIEEITELKSISFENGATPMLKKLTVSKCYKLTTLNKPDNFTAEISGDSACIP